MALTEIGILNCPDDKIHKLLSAEISRWLPDEENDLDEFVRRVVRMPVGLRAMAATFQLDVSMCFDDLGWHFGNWHHRGYCAETLRGLRELEAFEEADLFERAFQIALRYWDEIDDHLDRGDFFSDWYHDSDFEKETMPLSDRFWELQRIDEGLFGYWYRYARKYPRKVIDVPFTIVRP